VYFLDPSPIPSFNHSPENHTPHPLTQNTPSSQNSPSPRTLPTPLPQWGIIPLRLSPSPSPSSALAPHSHNKEATHAKESTTAAVPPVTDPLADNDSEFDFTTPLPSSEIGASSFIVPEMEREAGSDSVKPRRKSVSGPSGDERQRRVEEWVERRDEMSRSGRAREDLASGRGESRLQRGQSSVSRGWRRL
jgi:hypothetical protein